MRQFRQERQYKAIRWAVEEDGHSVVEACRILHVSRAGYYQWRSGKISPRAAENKRIAEMVKEIHRLSPDKGYRRIRDDLARYCDTGVNDKRVRRICQSLEIKSTIKYAGSGCTKRSSDPQHIAQNLLNRKFHADKPNEKWLTDVTEFKYYIGPTVHKIYLSAILDLCDRRIVAAVTGDSNDNALVYATFDQAVKDNPDAHPLFHSDRGFQYTTQVFRDKLEAAGMTQSMSRIGKCIDNGPMEGFWGILKRERYYGRRFASREELLHMIEDYIDYYNSKRLQRGLGILTPLEKHELCLAA